jgi:hypothetical protein
MPTISAWLLSPRQPWHLAQKTATRLVLPVRLATQRRRRRGPDFLASTPSCTPRRWIHPFGNCRLFHGLTHIRQGVQLVPVNLVADNFWRWSTCSYNTFHCGTMERADPAIVRTAASRSAAVMSFILCSDFLELRAGDLSNLDRMRRRRSVDLIALS